MTLVEWQRDARRAFAGGDPGAVVSGLVWLAAALVLRQRGTPAAFALLFFGGMVIFPAASLLARFAFRRTPVLSANPLGRVALESTICMIGGLFGAWLMLGLRAAFALLPTVRDLRRAPQG